MIPSSSAGIELVPQCGTQFVLAAGVGPQADDAERRAAALPRLMVMRATARIMFLKRAMFAFDQSVWLASAVR